MSGPLDGRVALVTGASRGIGRGIALALAAAGASVAVADVHPAPYRGERYYRLRERWSGADEEQSTAERIEAAGGSATTLEMDVTEPGSIAAAVRGCEAALGPVDVLVNNAGIVNNIATIEQMQLERWEHELRVNLTGGFNCVQATVPAMAARGWGRVINLSSIAALAPGLGQPAYAASKAAVIAFTRSVAQEFGPRGVTCNAVLPGLIGTPLVRSMPAHLREEIVGRTPVGRLGEPADIGHLVAFLASPAAGFITGTAIPCDGGVSSAPLRGLGTSARGPDRGDD